MPIKNAAVCAVSRASSWFRVPLFQVGSKKVARLPPLWTTLLAPDLEATTSIILELDQIW